MQLASSRLSGETSPYLLAHAAQPIAWFPWGDEAFEEAARRDVPVFLSSGYASCHWCHRMAQDAFQDPIVAELLNAHFGFAELPVASPVAEEETLAPNEYIGEAQSFGGTLRVKVTMDGDKIAKIDILSHSDTAGVCNPAYDTVPGKIIDAQSTNVDAATNATISSKAIMAAVEDALSKVGK